jgi:hypothetical protein
VTAVPTAIRAKLFCLRAQKTKCFGDGLEKIMAIYDDCSGRRSRSFIAPPAPDAKLVFSSRFIRAIHTPTKRGLAADEPHFDQVEL